MINSWDDLVFWESGEFQVIQERLKDFRKRKLTVVPAKELLFAALDEVPYDEVKVMLVGGEPYHDLELSAGLAFSVPSGVLEYPDTLKNIFKEYQTDLHYAKPDNGDLTKWCRQGVLLWNCIPTAFTNNNGSHNWPEWEYLNKEIIEQLSKKKIVFGFFGGNARKLVKYVDQDTNKVFEASSPAPTGIKFSKKPFLGSRPFSTINALLVELGKKPVDWKLG